LSLGFFFQTQQSPSQTNEEKTCMNNTTTPQMTSGPKNRRDLWTLTAILKVCEDINMYPEKLAL